MNTLRDEGRHRFLRAIAEVVPEERVAEVHLFPPIQQGGLETGVAVIAAFPAAVEEVVAAEAISSELRPITSLAPPSLHRLTVYRALYRWTRKGPDRGRWEIQVTEEADAPLEAVGDVVRGVYRRAGTGSEPERLSAVAFRAAVSDEPWTAGR